MSIATKSMFEKKTFEKVRLKIMILTTWKNYVGIEIK